MAAGRFLWTFEFLGKLLWLTLPSLLLPDKVNPASQSLHYSPELGAMLTPESPTTVPGTCNEEAEEQPPLPSETQKPGKEGGSWLKKMGRGSGLHSDCRCNCRETPGRVSEFPRTDKALQG